MSDPVLDDIDDLNEYMELLRNLSDSTDCYYVIAEDKVTHQPIGTCCAVVKDGGSCWDIGYCIHPTCWRKGYAKEMVNALVQFGAQNGIKTVLADVAAENAGSCGVMRALGFTPTENGTFRRSGSQTEYKSLTFKKAVIAFFIASCRIFCYTVYVARNGSKVLSASLVVMLSNPVSLILPTWNKAGYRGRNFFEGNFPEPDGEGRDVE